MHEREGLVSTGSGREGVGRSDPVLVTANPGCAAVVEDRPADCVTDRTVGIVFAIEQQRASAPEGELAAVRIDGIDGQVLALGDHREMLRALRHRIAQILQDPNVPAVAAAALSRQISLISKELDVMEADPSEDGVAVAAGTPDADFDISTL